MVEEIKIKKVHVEENGKQMDVFIPQSNDRQENEYIEVAEIEKTKDQLKKKPIKEQSKISKSDIAGAMKEKMEFDRRRKSDHPKRYF